MTRRYHEPPSRLVAEVLRPTSGDRIRVRLIGERPTHCDMRIYDTTRRSQGEPRPSQAGISIRLELLDELIAALAAAKKEASR